ncbi:MAG TPA: TadE/TadG family type IV pilus assembly protein [Anaerolineae bacterium]|nr:TadE/TadG family type IV pilus assembly protein [Anaerolineae bacterium]HOR01231.1 TadE/TadG family type IV pilus assembly protein [Anaerolineae bacterium]HPL29392.1 TadE/TadG family type IV pilus assembly protein [Anaerolineae bacterium]
MSAPRESGQSAVELAILLPVLLLIALGCLDLGRAFAVRMALANGAREGAHYASMFPLAPAGRGSLTAICQETERDITAQGLSASSLRVVPSAPEGWLGGKPVKVTASYTLPMLTSYLFGGQPLIIRASSQMIIIGGY